MTLYIAMNSTDLISWCKQFARYLFVASFEMQKRPAGKPNKLERPCKVLKEGVPLSTVAEQVKPSANCNEIWNLNSDCLLLVFSHLSKPDLFALCVADERFRDLLLDSRMFKGQLDIDKEFLERFPLNSKHIYIYKGIGQLIKDIRICHTPSLLGSCRTYRTLTRWSWRSSSDTFLCMTANWNKFLVYVVCAGTSFSRVVGGRDFSDTWPQRWRNSIVPELNCATCKAWTIWPLSRWTQILWREALAFCSSAVQSLKDSEWDSWKVVGSVIGPTSPTDVR